MYAYLYSNEMLCSPLAVFKISEPFIDDTKRINISQQQKFIEMKYLDAPNENKRKTSFGSFFCHRKSFPEKLYYIFRVGCSIVHASTHSNYSKFGIHGMRMCVFGADVGVSLLVSVSSANRKWGNLLSV